MREVTIYDMGDPTRRRTIYADSGNMRMTNGVSDLELTLYSGNTQVVPVNNHNGLQRLYFNTDVIRVRGVGNQFQKTTLDSYKSDREMTVCEMQEAQDRARRDHELARMEFEKKVAQLKKEKVQLNKDVLNQKTSAPWDIGLGRLYCKVLASFAPKQAKAQGVSSTPPRRLQLPQTASSTPKTVAPQPPLPANIDIPMLENLRLRLSDTATLMNSYGVEIHKKFALAVACFVFVLLGAPIALRFPRGGVGLTIGVSLFVFALYYVCLIAGESIAKRGMMPAVVSMWMANVIFSLIALWLLAKMGQEGSTARGGDLQEMMGAIKGSIRSKIGRRDRRVGRERIAA
jgi:lipopolysaccharide export system permease protein